MKFASLACAFALLTPFAGQAAPRVRSLDTSGFALHVTRQWNLSVIPLAALDHGLDAQTAQRKAEGIILTSPARKPTSYHARQPKTELCEATAWPLEQMPSTLRTTLRVDQFPTGGTLVLAELISEPAAAPILQFRLEKDRVILVGTHAGLGKNGVVVGTVASDHVVHLELNTTAGSTFNVNVNGTQSVFSLPQGLPATPVAYCTGAHTEDDIGTTPDTVKVTLMALSARHSVK